MGLLTTLVGSFTGTMLVCYGRALKKHPFFARPWEHLIFGVIGGGWAANKLIATEDAMRDLLDKQIKAKIERNEGELGEGWREVLGEKLYAKYFPDKSS